jgi:hypothetical protein
MGGPWCYAGARPAVHAMPCQQCWLHNPKHDARAEKPLKKNGQHPMPRIRTRSGCTSIENTHRGHHTFCV